MHNIRRPDVLQGPRQTSFSLDCNSWGLRDVFFEGIPHEHSSCKSNVDGGGTVQRLNVGTTQSLTGNFTIASYLPQELDLPLGRLCVLWVALTWAIDRLLLDDSFSPLHFHQLPFWLREKKSLKRLAGPLELYNWPQVKHVLNLRGAFVEYSFMFVLEFETTANYVFQLVYHGVVH